MRMGSRPSSVNIERASENGFIQYEKFLLMLLLALTKVFLNLQVKLSVVC